MSWLMSSGWLHRIWGQVGRVQHRNQNQESMQLATTIRNYCGGVSQPFSNTHSERFRGSDHGAGLQLFRSAAADELILSALGPDGDDNVLFGQLEVGCQHASVEVRLRRNSLYGGHAVFQRPEMYSPENPQRQRAQKCWVSQQVHRCETQKAPEERSPKEQSAPRCLSERLHAHWFQSMPPHRWMTSPHLSMDRSS